MSELEKILNKHNITEKELNKILKDTKKPEPLQYNEYKLPYNEKHVKFTVISDTHMGHNKYNPDILTHAIKNSKRQHSEFFFHCGDIVEGMSGREGHIYELTHIGASKQMDYAVEQLSQIDIPIYAITATNSHD
jgi:metal-dependent hydrolase (beta-lactamase superfamily II)